MDFNNFYTSGNGNECSLQVSYLLIYFTSRKYDVTVTFMTLMSCDSICCMYGNAWTSHWLMTQLTNGQYVCMLVFMPMVDILNIPCDRQFVFSVQCTWLTLYFTPCFMQWVLECGPMPNVMATLPNIGGALCSIPQFGWLLECCAVTLPRRKTH